MSIYTVSIEDAKKQFGYFPIELPTQEELKEEGCELRGWGGETPTSFKKGNIPWSKGKKCPSLSKNKTLYWEQWRKDNPNYKDKWKKYVPIGRENWKKVDNVSAINNTMIECPHCGKGGNVGNMKRWHYDNCKKKRRI